MPGRLLPELLQRAEERIRKAARFKRAARAALERRDFETATSRCYYAAYHDAVALLMANGYPVADASTSHDYIINTCIHLGTRQNKWFTNLKMRGAKDFAESFRILYNFRLEADYSLTPMDRERARRALDFVDRFHQAANERMP